MVSCDVTEIKITLSMFFDGKVKCFNAIKTIGANSLSFSFT